MKFFNWARSQPAEKQDAKPKEPVATGSSFFSTHMFEHGGPLRKVADILTDIVKGLPKVEAIGAMDDANSSNTLKIAAQPASLPEVLALWYASQGFIGHQLCAILSQHWLINKACSMPARDAIRNGFDIVTVDGDDIDPEAVKLLRRADRKMRLNWNLEQFVRMGRVFGIRVAFFKVKSTDENYYENPFNIDGVTPGSYEGIVQVDPYWMAPQLEGVHASDPSEMHFYEPTYWIIHGKKYHRSHLIIFRNAEVPDLLKPQYLYGGVPVPQQIMERVYAAERVANEAPQLAQTKRTNVWLTNMGAFAAKGDEAIEMMNRWIYFRDNYNVKMGDKDGDEFQQTDTSLADLDSVIMTQYQIVAAAANVPATKMLGTTPKGFNSTGEYEEASYHEELESIQMHDLTPFVERHHALVWRSVVAPKLREAEDTETTVNWKPVDSPTAKEQADINLVKAQTGAALVNSGALASEDERKRISMDPEGGYAGLDLGELPEQDNDEEDDGDGDQA